MYNVYGEKALAKFDKKAVAKQIKAREDSSKGWSRILMSRAKRETFSRNEQ